MDKKELIIFGLFTIIALFILFRSISQPEVTLEQPGPPVIAPIEPVPEVIPEVPEIPPEIPEVVIPEGVPFPTPPIEEEEPTPSKTELTPAYVEFEVNRIIVPEYFPHFIPIHDDDIKTYSGKFGPYYEDYSEYIYVELCKHVRDAPESIACEKVRDIHYTDGFFGFARGYPPDEYLANVAMRNFNAYYLVVSKEHGVLAKSNVAPIRIVRD